jgi:hypothetical protein
MRLHIEDAPAEAPNALELQQLAFHIPEKRFLIVGGQPAVWMPYVSPDAKNAGEATLVRTFDRLLIFSIDLPVNPRAEEAGAEEYRRFLASIRILHPPPGYKAPRAAPSGSGPTPPAGAHAGSTRNSLQQEKPGRTPNVIPNSSQPAAAGPPGVPTAPPDGSQGTGSR